MAKPEEATFVGELWTLNIYKRNQGRLARQLTGGAIAVVFLLGAGALYNGPLLQSASAIRTGIPLAIAAIGCWLAFRVVNYPKFADFLISVETEMNKVSWASKSELYRATIVVLVTMFALAFVMRAFDAMWALLLKSIGILSD